MFWELAKPREYQHSVLVTNDTFLAPEDIQRTYGPRANEENAIKELKEWYGWHELGVCAALGHGGGDAAARDGVLEPGVQHLNRAVLKTAGEGEPMPTLGWEWPRAICGLKFTTGWNGANSWACGCSTTMRSEGCNHEMTRSSIDPNRGWTYFIQESTSENATGALKRKIWFHVQTNAMPS